MKNGCVLYKTQPFFICFFDNFSRNGRVTTVALTLTTVALTLTTVALTLTTVALALTCVADTWNVAYFFSP